MISYKKDGSQHHTTPTTNTLWKQPSFFADAGLWSGCHVGKHTYALYTILILYIRNFNIYRAMRLWKTQSTSSIVLARLCPSFCLPYATFMPATFNTIGSRFQKATEGRPNEESSLPNDFAKSPSAKGIRRSEQPGSVSYTIFGNVIPTEAVLKPEHPTPTAHIKPDNQVPAESSPERVWNRTNAWVNNLINCEQIPPLQEIYGIITIKVMFYNDRGIKKQ